MSLSQGQFPNSWKRSNFIPLLKKSDPTSKENYRPISLLPSLSKVFERCVSKYVFNYLRDNSILTSNQSAYSPGDSSVCQLVSLYHDLCQLLDKGNDVEMIFLT